MASCDGCWQISGLLEAGQPWARARMPRNLVNGCPTATRKRSRGNAFRSVNRRFTPLHAVFQQGRRLLRKDSATLRLRGPGDSINPISGLSHLPPSGGLRLIASFYPLCRLSLAESCHNRQVKDRLAKRNVVFDRYASIRGRFGTLAPSILPARVFGVICPPPVWIGWGAKV